MANEKQQASSSALPNLLGAAFEYMVDAAQRSILFWDVMRQRGNQYREHVAETVPHVLDYDAELVMRWPNAAEAGELSARAGRSAVDR